MIAVNEVTKRFGATPALDAASLQVRPGTTHVLLGSSGSGKSTMLRLILGLIWPDAGSVRVDGVPVDFRRPLDAIRSGVAMVDRGQELWVESTDSREEFGILRVILAVSVVDDAQLPWVCHQDSVTRLGEDSTDPCGVRSGFNDDQQEACARSSI